jgi:LAO/AO transport system kinase
MASRGHLGGLSWATPQAIRVLDAAGFDVVLVETVGVGQSEVEVAGAADTTVVLLAPGMGDGVQAAKAGILEIGDVFVVNKADRDGADSTSRELRHMITLGSGPRAGSTDDPWTPPVLKTVAARGEGITEVVDAVTAHQEGLARTGELDARRRARAASEVEAIAFGILRARIGDLRGDVRLDALAARVVGGELDPYAAADTLVAGLAL